MTFIVALIAGAGIAFLAMWLRSRNMGLAWYEWLIGVIGLGLFLFAIQNYFGSLAESEAAVAPMFLLVVGLPAIILLLVAWQLAARRLKKAS